LWCGLFGALLIGASTVLDLGDLNVDFDLGPDWTAINARGIPWGLALGGLLGGVVELTTGSLLVGSLVGIAVGAGTAAAVSHLFGWLQHDAGGEMQDDSVYLAASGTLVVPFDAETGIGVIRLVAAGQVQELPALRSEEDAQLVPEDGTPRGTWRVVEIREGFLLVTPVA